MEHPTGCCSPSRKSTFGNAGSAASFRRIPGFPDLARAVRIAAEAVLDLARAEESEADQIADRQAAAMPTIDASPAPTDLAAILAEWRAVERRLDAADPTSPEAARLMAEFESLRDRYAQALKAYRG